MAVAGFACFAAIASAPLAVTSLGENGIALPGLSSAQRLMAMLDARSPGERTKGELTKVKRMAFVPRERALGKVFPPKPSPEEQLALLVVPAPPPVQTVPPITPVAPPAVVDVINPASLVAFAGGPAVIGGSILPPPPSIAPPLLTIVPSAVPEPASWLMMLLGFGITGLAIRRRPGAQLSAA